MYRILAVFIFSFIGFFFGKRDEFILFVCLFHADAFSLFSFQLIVSMKRVVWMKYSIRCVRIVFKNKCRILQLTNALNFLCGVANAFFYFRFLTVFDFLSPLMSYFYCSPLCMYVCILAIEMYSNFFRRFTCFGFIHKDQHSW